MGGGQALRTHKASKLVYNGAMPLPASLVASIVSAVIEAAAQSAGALPQQYEIYATTRTLPPEAKSGVMLPPQNDGTVTIDGRSWPLTPGVQFRNQKNLIVMPMSIQEEKDVVFITNPSGAVFRVWMVSAAELSARPNN